MCKLRRGETVRVEIVYSKYMKQFVVFVEILSVCMVGGLVTLAVVY